MKKILFLLLIFLFSLSYAETVPVVIGNETLRGEKVGDFIFVLDRNLVLYKDKVYNLKKIENLYLSEDLGILFDGKNISKIISFPGFVFSEEKEIIIKDGKKYGVKKKDGICFAITGYSINQEGFKLFAYGINPKWKYILIELCIVNFGEKPLDLQQNMFRAVLGNRYYYPDGSGSIYLHSEKKEVLFRKRLNPKDGVLVYLVYDMPITPDKLIIDLNLGLENLVELRLP